MTADSLTTTSAPRRRGRLGALAALATAVALLGSLISVPVAASAAGTGSITGEITLDSVPVSSYSYIELFNTADPAGQYQNTIASTTAGGSTFSFDGLEDGTYKVKVPRIEQSPNWYPAAWYQGGTSYATATPIVIANGQAVVINVPLKAGYDITLTTIDSAGEPVLYGEITLVTAEGEYVDYRPIGYEGTAGETRFKGLTPGSYRATVVPNGGPYAQKQFTVTVSAGANNATLVVPTGATTSGIVTDADGAPISGGVNVQAISTSGDLVASDDIDEDGVYELSSVTPGDYLLYFYDYTGYYISSYYGGATTSETATPVSLASGTNTFNAALALSPAIDGTVSVSGPLGAPDNFQVRIEAYDAVSGENVNSAYPSADGSYHFPLPAGSYKLAFTSQQGFATVYSGGAATIEDAAVITVVDGQVTSGVDAAFIGGAAISGRVTAEGFGQSGFINIVSPSNPDYYLRVESNYQGYWSAYGLPAGDYKATVYTNDDTYASIWYGGAATQASATTIDLDADELFADADFDLPLGAVVTGSVLGADTGQRIDATVTIADAAGDLVSQGYVGYDGGYTDVFARKLPAGEYTLYVDAYRYQGGYLTETAGELTDDVALAKTFTVTAGETTTFDAVTLIKQFSYVYAPVITGTTRVGDTLAATIEEWSPVTDFSYEWLRGDVVVASTPTYTTVAEDLGADIALRITSTATGIATQSATSEPVTIQAAITTFSKTPVPTISGTATVGKKLTAVTGTWTPAATFSYQWKRNGASISGATKSAYTLTATDAGKKITVVVTGKKTGFTTVSKTSAAKTAVGVFTAATPKISGTAKVGKTVKVTVGTWTPKPTFTYQWKRSGASISGATKSSYKLTSKDKGKKITVVVTGKKTGYTTVAKTSASTKAVAK